MDLSKLPRMSETPPPPSPVHEPDPHSPAAHPGNVYDTPRVGGGFAEGWISIAIGVILLFAYPYTWQWLLSLASGYRAPFLPITLYDPNTGVTTEISYTQSTFFFGHLCVFAFALVLIFDGLILFTRRTSLMTIAFAVTIVATFMNFIYLIQSTMSGAGFQIIPALAVAFGIYIALHQWRLIAMMRAYRRGA